MPRGGNKPKKDFKPRVGGAGAQSKRTDMSTPDSPDLTYTDLDYGDGAAISQIQSAAPGGGGRRPLNVPNPRGVLNMLTEGPSQRPYEDITAGAQEPRQSALTASEAAFALGEMIRALPDVSAGMLRMYQDLKKEAMFDSNRRMDFDRVFPGEGPF